MTTHAEKIREARKLYLAGVTIEEIAARFGVSKSSARRFADPRLFVNDLAAEGRTSEEIAARIGSISASRVADFLNPNSDRKSLWPEQQPGTAPR
jgi:hypothetical protein